jgi:CubicO group peptidase (beta-lactamase class C family)
MRLRPFLPAALIALTPGLLRGQKPADRFGPAWAPLAAFFHSSLQEEGVVGGAVALVAGDSVMAKEFHGFADLATKRPVTAETIFHWASVTKTFTAIALLQLRDRGLLSLEDPVVRWVPELAAVHNQYGSMGSITLRQLLSHSAGFRNPTWPWGGDQPWHPFEPTKWSQLVAMLPYTEILFPPGSKFSYSNPGYIFLGRTIEELTGEDYEVYLEKNVLRPLGMTSSYFDQTPYHLLARRSNNYDVRNGVAEPNGLDFDTGITVSNSGLNAPIADMVKYLRFLVGAPGLSEAARQVLARATLEEMWRPLVKVAAEEGDSIGLGFFQMTRNGIRLVGHTGSQRAFRSLFYLDPKSGAAIIAVFNTAPADDPRNPVDAPTARPRIPYLFNGLLERATTAVFPLFRR